MAALALEALFRRETAIVVAALVLLTLLAWLAVLVGAGTGMDPFAMSGWVLPYGNPAAESGTWTLGYRLISFFMWAAMMVAMMLPSTSPMVLLYARVMRQSARKGEAPGRQPPHRRVHRGLSLIVDSFQPVRGRGSVRTRIARSYVGDDDAAEPRGRGRAPHRGGHLSAHPAQGRLPRPLPRTGVVLAAHCRPGLPGAWRMGVAHGAYCVGCCLPLMLLLFIGGVMNLIWITGLTLIVLAEKFLPQGKRLSVLIGVLSIVAGGALAFAG